MSALQLLRAASDSSVRPLSAASGEAKKAAPLQPRELRTARFVLKQPPLFMLDDVPFFLKKKRKKTLSRNLLLANVATHGAADRLSIQQHSAFRGLLNYTCDVGHRLGTGGRTFQRRQGFFRAHFINCALLCPVALPQHVFRTHHKAS